MPFPVTCPGNTVILVASRSLAIGFSGVACDAAESKKVPFPFDDQIQMAQSLDPRQIEIPDDDVVDLMKSKTPTERLAMAFECHRLVRMRLAGHFRTLYPAWTEAEVDSAIARRFLSGAI